MAKQSDDGINLEFLRSIDNKIQKILLNCGQSALYEFVNGQWIRKNIEGTLFVVQRNEDPLFKIIVPNKLAAADVDTFQEIITDNYDISLEEPYALCKNADCVINCFWFYKKENCKAFETTIRNCLEKIREEKKKKTSITSRMEKLTINSVTAAKPDIPQMLSLEDIEKNILNGGDQMRQKQQQPQKVQDSSQKIENTQKALFESILQGRRMEDLVNLKASNGQKNIHESISPSEEDNVSKSGKPSGQPAVTNLPFPLKTIMESSMANSSPSQQQPPKRNSVTSKPATIPTSFSNKTPQKPANQQPTISVEELKQTLIHLLQNDADFLFKVFETYKMRVSDSN